MTAVEEVACAEGGLLGGGPVGGTDGGPIDGPPDGTVFGVPEGSAAEFGLWETAGPDIGT